MKSFIALSLICITLMLTDAFFIYRSKIVPVGIRLFFLLGLILFIFIFIQLAKNILKMLSEIKTLKKERDDLLDDQDDIYAN